MLWHTPFFIHMRMHTHTTCQHAFSYTCMHTHTRTMQLAHYILLCVFQLVESSQTRMKQYRAANSALNQRALTLYRALQRMLQPYSVWLAIAVCNWRFFYKLKLKLLSFLKHISFKLSTNTSGVTLPAKGLLLLLSGVFFLGFCAASVASCLRFIFHHVKPRARRM